MARLQPDGFLFVGISETLDGLELPLEREGPSIYSIKKRETHEK
jgi:hypothetical protein